MLVNAWFPAIAVVLAASIQAGVIVLARKYGISFWILVPLIIAHQYFFLSAYSKAPNFILIWFFAAALTSLLALIVGNFIFHDIISWKNYVGIGLIIAGIALTKL